MEDRQKIIEKLVQIKALAERGVGGEQQTAQQIFEQLLLPGMRKAFVFSV